MRPRNVEIPPYFRCPISFELMEDPVIISSGITYERENIKKWIKDGNQVCPVTRQELENCELIPNYTLSHLIKLWCSSNKQTSQIEEVRELKRNQRLQERLARLEKNQDGLENGFLQELEMCSLEDIIWNKAVDSDNLLAALMEKISSNAGVEQALSVLQKMCQVSSDVSWRVSSWQEFPVIVRLLKAPQKCTRVKAMLLFQALAEVDETVADADGCVEGLLGFLGGEGDDAVESEAALKCLIAACKCSKNRMKAIQWGAVKVLIRSISSTQLREPAVELLKTLCTCAEGRESLAMMHMEAVPAVLGCILSKASPHATEKGTLIMWELICHSVACHSVEDTFIEAGGLSTMVMVLQCDCSLVTKQRARDVLKHFSWLWKDTN